MSRNETTSAVISAILKLAATGATISVALLAPNALQALEKPLKKYFAHLDDQDRQRELQRVVRYMRSRKLLSGSYQYGLQITDEGRAQLDKLELNELHVATPLRWDHSWRIVFYDIPEARKRGRDALTRKLHSLGFWQMQKSVFIHPFPCREVIEALTVSYKIDEFVTYIETSYIDNEQNLITHFKKQIPNVEFK